MNANKKFIAFYTIVSKEIRRFLRIWPQTLLPPAITMALYFIIFGQLIGARVGEMGGVQYIQFIVPGLVMMSVITNAYANVSASFFSAKFQRSIEELLIAPVPNYIILLGFVIGGVCRGLAVGVIVLLTSLFFTHLYVEHIGLTLLVVFFTSTLFSLCGFINAVYANKFDDISIIPTFVLTPLTYLGGVFYSLEALSALSPIWQHIALVNPILYMVNAFRFGVIGSSETSVWFSVIMLIVLTIAMYVVAIYLLRSGKGLRQ